MELTLNEAVFSTLIKNLSNGFFNLDLFACLQVSVVLPDAVKQVGDVHMSDGETIENLLVVNKVKICHLCHLLWFFLCLYSVLDYYVI